MPIQTSRWGRMKQLVSDIAAALLVAGLALSASQDAIAQVAASTATLKSDLSSRTPAPSGWREILALDGVLAFKAPKDVLVVPHFDRYSSSEFQAQGLRISFWFDANPVSLEESVVIGGRPARISDHKNFFAIFLPDVTKPTPGGIREIKGLRLNVTHDGKREEALAIIRSLRFSKPGNAIDKAAQAQAASYRKWKPVVAGDILTFDAPPGLQLLEPTASDPDRHRLRAPGFEVVIESRKIAHPPAEYAGKEAVNSRLRINEHWAEVFVKPGQMIACFCKSLSATEYEGPVIEFRFDDFEAQENAIALLQTIRLQPLTAQRVRAATPVPLLRDASAEDQLFFAIAFTAIDDVITTRGAEGATVEYEGDTAIVTFPHFSRDNVPRGFSGRVSIDRASGTLKLVLVSDL